MPLGVPRAKDILGSACPCQHVPGSNGQCLVHTDIRKDIRVTIDILVELSVPSRISMLTDGYPWRIIVRDTMDNLVE